VPAKGSNHYRSKLNERVIPEIRRLLETGMRVSHIADRFGVSYSTIRDIRDGETWRHVTNDSRRGVG